jgi:hypothetical protein
VIAEKTVGRTPERSGRAWTLQGREKEKVLVEVTVPVRAGYVTFSGVLKLHRSVVTRINPQLGSNTRRKYKWYSSAHLLATLVTHVGTPSSGSTLDNTYIWIGLDLTKPSIDKPIGRLTTIVPPRTTLRKILSST